jgi:DNA repair photolyase
VRRVSLAPEDVQALFFWTRFPEPLLVHLRELDDLGFRTVFHVTVTGLPPDLEPFPHPLDRRIAAVQALAERIGPGRVWWRYDPIVAGDVLTPAWHEDTFGKLAEALSGSTTRVTLSLLDWYRKTERGLRRVADLSAFARQDGTEPEVVRLVSALAAKAAASGMHAVSCCEPALAAAGVASGACIDAAAVHRLFGIPRVEGTDPGQRPGCRCAPSYDIGTANTCRGGCVYCYATHPHGREQSALE